MTFSLDQLIHNSLIEICQNCNDDFSGLGIVYYENLIHLPYISLHKEELLLDIESKNFNETLIKISRYSSAYHDGFHFINVESKKITHISQYISPSLESVANINMNHIIPCGAREMTAFLTSNIEGVFCVGLISANKTIKIFKDGSIIYQQVSA